MSREDQRDFSPHPDIHGEKDGLVPLENAKEIYRHLESEEKELLVIPAATHNDIMMVGFKDYFKTIQQFVERSDRIKEGKRREERVR